MTNASTLEKSAIRQVRDFEGEYSSLTLRLAYHAALPAALNANLVHFLRINFFLDPPEMLPYTAEADLLLSHLCHEIGDDLYEIEPEVRNLLLRGLVDNYGQERVREVALLLWQYNQRYAPWTDRIELERAQQLTVLNFLDPARAKQWLEETYTGTSSAEQHEWFVAMRRDLKRVALLSYDNKSLIDREFLHRLVQTFLKLPNIDNRRFRDSILVQMGNPFPTILIRSDSAHTDIASIVDQLINLRLQTGGSALSLFIETVLSLVEGTQLGQELVALKRQLQLYERSENQITNGDQTKQEDIELVGAEEKKDELELAAIGDRESELVTMEARAEEQAASQDTPTLIQLAREIVQAQKMLEDIRRLFDTQEDIWPDQIALARKNLTYVDKTMQKLIENSRDLLSDTDIIKLNSTREDVSTTISQIEDLSSSASSKQTRKHKENLAIIRSYLTRISESFKDALTMLNIVEDQEQINHVAESSSETIAQSEKQDDKKATPKKPRTAAKPNSRSNQSQNLQKYRDIIELIEEQMDTMLIPSLTERKLMSYNEQLTDIIRALLNVSNQELMAKQGVLNYLRRARDELNTAILESQKKGQTQQMFSHVHSCRSHLKQALEYW